MCGAPRGLCKSWVVSGTKVSKFVSVDQHCIINFLAESHPSQVWGGRADGVWDKLLLIKKTFIECDNYII